MAVANERIKAALSFQEADRVPVIPLIAGATRRVLGINYTELSLNPELAARSMLHAQELLGYDALFAALDASVEVADHGAKMVYPPDSTPYPDYSQPLLKDERDYLRLEPFDPTRTPRTNTVLKIIDILVKEKGKEMPVMGFVMGPLCILSMLRGNEKLFKDCLRCPEKVRIALEVVIDVQIAYVKAQASRGVDGICLQQLFPSKSIMSKRMWEEIEAPYARKIVQEIKRWGLGVTVHNCGDSPYFDAMIEHLNPDCISFSKLPEDCKDHAELKEKYGQRVVLAGHVDCNLLLFGTPQEVMRECKEQIKGLAKGGGFILASACEFPPDGPLMNAKAMVEAVNLYGVYQ